MRYHHGARSLWYSPSTIMTGALCCLCVAAYAISTPRGSIWSASAIDISTSSSLLNSDVVGSGGIYYIIYAVLLWLLADALFVPKRDSKRRVVIVITAIFLIVFILDFIAGRRGSVGLVVGGVGLYATKYFPDGVNAATRKRFFKVAGVALSCAIAAYLLGTVRYDLVDKNVTAKSIRQNAEDFFATGTWYGGITTNLVTMHFYRSDAGFQFLLGRTYIDYVLSLPPKQVATLLQYERPLEADKSPNWWFVGYNAGGISPTVVPFYNFGALGVFFVMLLEGAFVSYAEFRVRRGDLFGVLLYAAICTVSLVWYWYGDMPLVRALMSFAIVGAIIKAISVLAPPRFSVGVHSVRACDRMASATLKTRKDPGERDGITG